ncbi:MAG: 1,4-dihydroxy-2-naphthoate octaprenyltransferase [Chloroflexota bacterium]|nr:1,4-dihydroxy-2-naphthoate octaprenyltransferase [Chloroflexota bacterium]
MDKLSSIIIGFRLKTLPAVLGPLLLVISIGLNNSINIYKIALVIFIGIFLQILVNLLNDVQDFNQGLDNENRVGPLRASQQGYLSKSEMNLLILIIIIICLILGLIAFFISDFYTLIIGIVLFGLAYTYTGGPKPYGYNGLGEVGVITVFGPITILGSLYIFDIHPTLKLLLLSLIPGISASLIILINNIRDLENDKKGEKNTIAVILGEKKSRYLYYLLVILISCLLTVNSITLENKYFLIPAIISLFIFPLNDLGFNRWKKKKFLIELDIKKSKISSELNNTLIKTVASHFILCITLSILLLF